MRRVARLGSIAIILLSATVRLPAQANRYRMRPEEPHWLKVRVTGASLGVYTEGISEQSTFGGSSTVDYRRLFVGPSVGLDLQGSIYHPNLARFIISSETAFGLGSQETRSAAGNFRRDEFQQLGNFRGTMYLLNNKPYSSSLFANYDHTFRDYDFFNRTTVDGWRYGGQTGYRDGPVPFTINVWRLDETEENVVAFRTLVRTNLSTGVTRTNTRPVFGMSGLKQTTLAFETHNDRPNGTTRFTYGLTDYSRSGFGPESGGSDQTFGLTDAETFGEHRQIMWNNDAGYAMRHFTDSPSDDFNANSHLSIDHTPKVSTFYDANYYRATFGGNSSDNYNASAAVRHQLYESLTTTLRGEGQRFSYDGPDGSSASTRFGVSLGESYTKRINGGTYLTANGSIGYDHNIISQAGSVITAVDERHSFPTGAGGGLVDTFFLNLPNVDETTIVLTDETRTLTYIEGLDYTVSLNGLLIRITRMAGAQIPAGGAVLATYSAEPSPSGTYDTLSGQLQIRVDFWNGLLGVYGRVNSVNNSGTRGLVVQDLSAFAFGADTTWRFLRAGLEYELYNSTFSSYRSARLFESLTFRPDDVSTLNLDFSQTRTEYVEAHREEELFSFISRYHRRITSHLGGDLEAGISLRNGPGVDQTLAAVRPGLEFAMGKLSIKMGYDFEYQRFLDTEERIKHMFFLRAKRSF